MKLTTLALVAASLLAGCATVPTSVSGARGAAALAPLPSDQVAKMFIETVKQVEPVAEKTCRQISPERICDLRIVIDDRDGLPPNAYQTEDAMGRPVIVFTIAMLGEIQNADELAFVLGHEASHHILGHLDRQRYNAAVGAEVFGRLAGTIGTGVPSDVKSAQELGASIGARTYSKSYELEADGLGAQIVTIAGYNPLHGAEFFLRIPDPGDSFLGSHPSNAERIAAVERAVFAM